MKEPIWLGVLVVSLFGCVSIQTTPALRGLAARPLPFKGQLVGGRTDYVPPAVAAARAEAGPIEFRYNEKFDHGETTVPMVVGFVLSPVVLLGMPLGQYRVEGTATLLITDADRPVGEYEARVRVARTYGLYYGSTYRELQDAAHTQLQRAIDEQLYRDADRIQAALEPRAEGP